MTLVGRDRRIKRLVASDRLAPPSKLARGGALLVELVARGESRVELVARFGGAILSSLAGRGTARVAVAARGAAEMGALTAQAAGHGALVASGHADLAQLAASSAGVVRLGASGEAALPALLSGAAARTLVEAAGSAELEALLGAGSGEVPDPVTVTEGAVSSWFDLSHPLSVVTGSGYSSVYDRLNAVAPATQSVDAQRPPSATSDNGLPLLDMSNDFLSVPLHSGNNGSGCWAFWGWVRVLMGNTGGNRTLVCIENFAANMASDKKCRVRIVNTGVVEFLIFDPNGSGFVGRGRVSNVVINPDVWWFITAEFNGAHASEAQRQMTSVNGAVTGGSFYNPSTPPVGNITALRTPSGNAVLGVQTTSTIAEPFVGKQASNFGFVNAPMAGCVEGALTRLGRQGLASIDPPFVPSVRIHSLVAHWSANESGGVGGLQQRVPGSGVHSFTQANAVEQPTLLTLVNGVKAYRFDGSIDDMWATDTESLRFTGRGCWAFHLRPHATGINDGRRFFTQWGTTERLSFAWHDASASWRIYLATSPISYSQARAITNDSGVGARAGCWLVLKYDGAAADNNTRLRIYEDDVELTMRADDGMVPAALLAGDALQIWFGSLNGGTNLAFDVAHAYVFDDIPTDAELAMARDFEAPDWS